MNYNKVQPFFSIITVCYNSEKTIERTIKSVLFQDFKDYEYIVIDGKSTDNTLKILDKYQSNLTYYSEKDGGVYDAMNKGILKAKGHYIAIINSDDWYEKGTFGLIYNEIQKHPNRKIFHGNRLDHYPNGKQKVNGFNHSKFLFRNFRMTYNHPSFFVKKEVYDNNLYDINFPVIADYHFTLKLHMKNPEIFHFIPKTYVNYALGGISSQNMFGVRTNEGIRMRKNLMFPRHKIFLYWLLRQFRLMLKFKHYLILKSQS